MEFYRHFFIFMIACFIIFMRAMEILAASHKKFVRPMAICLAAVACAMVSIPLALSFVENLRWGFLLYSMGEAMAGSAFVLSFVAILNGQAKVNSAHS